jgi:hypothetical protein
MTILFAEWNCWFWLAYLSNISSRGSVITLCIVIVCMSLFIMMKK